MRFMLLPAAMALSFALAGAASADPAPIVYAGRAGEPAVQTASLESRLAGGADNSYGYGRESSHNGALIDIRRTSAPQAPPAQIPAAPQATQLPDQGAQTRPAWLEQERVGPPYEANGRWYVPTPEPGYEEEGQASWYGPAFHGQAAANGEVYDQEAMTAAHPTLPLNSLVQVTNLENSREVIVRITDRGPFVGERLIDLSHAAATMLGFEQNGRARVHVRYLGPAPRRVNASGAALPAPAPSPAPSPRMAQSGGPISLLPTPVEPAAPAPTLQQASYVPPAASGAFVVQVGAFSDLENAHRVRAAVESAGPVNVDIRQSARGELYRVRLGPYATPEQARAAQQSLAGLGYPEAMIAQP